MPPETRLMEVDPRAASDEKLLAILKLCRTLKWFAHLLEKSWTHPAAHINNLGSTPEGPLVPAIPDVVQAWLEGNRPHVTELRLCWSTRYPIAEYSHYPLALSPWLAHLLEGVEVLLSSTPDNESEGVKVANSLVQLAKRLELAATNPVQALASSISKEFENHRAWKLIEESNRRQSGWRSASIPRYDEYSRTISTAESPIESTAFGHADSYTDDSLLSPPRLAEVLSVHPQRMNAFVKMLERKRISLGSGGFQELKDVPMHQHKYVYRLGSVRGLAGRYQEAPSRPTKSRADVRPNLF